MISAETFPQADCIVHDYQADLSAYINREISLDELARRLEIALASPGIPVHQLLAALDDAHRMGHLKKCDHARLRDEIILAQDSAGMPAITEGIASIDFLPLA